MRSRARSVFAMSQPSGDGCEPANAARTTRFQGRLRGTKPGVNSTAETCRAESLRSPPYEEELSQFQKRGGQAIRQSLKRWLVRDAASIPAPPSAQHRQMSP